LTEKYEKGKPIFVFLHQHLNTNNVNGWVGTDQAKEITDILTQYPEATGAFSSAVNNLKAILSHFLLFSMSQF